METGNSHHREREARFLDGVGAFIRRDFDAMERTMHPDVVMHLPGSSWLAGTYRGPEEVGRCILGLRYVLESSEDRATFSHQDDSMVVTHDIRLHGPLHDLDMTFSVTLRFDTDERIVRVDVEAADPGLFDHVVQTALLATDSPHLA